MPKYRNALPQLAADKLFLTDGGLETEFIFHHGIDLPLFACISLFFGEAEHLPILYRYYEDYITAAKSGGYGFVLVSANWRASPDWLRKLGLPEQEWVDVNRHAITFLEELRAAHETPEFPMIISSQIGPRGDGYSIENKMTADEAQDYHAWQTNLFAETEADMIDVLTINYVEEAVGIANAAKESGMPVVISFTVETDGRLPSGQLLGEAIEETDAVTGNYPIYYMLNCAHPDHFDSTLKEGGQWVSRIRALRANASRLSHAELDEAETIDSGDPEEFGKQHAALRESYPGFVMFGGCCGTDSRHVKEIARACATLGGARTDLELPNL
ncbi:MAG: homocysteine S-methyltransferase [Gammaproteobacteria bacterium]|jgi:S-methylmethionine-dependent homocysteine/selenocysteine methylase|nr:homocysteine S-methyltransferase [Gammaproteobacteria bacterium]|tara:strand:+ start:1998 stop:2984 length:987 start_codon:yes stop_codon:yes gene_type:complete